MLHSSAALAFQPPLRAVLRSHGTQPTAIPTAVRIRSILRRSATIRLLAQKWSAPACGRSETLSGSLLTGMLTSEDFVLYGHHSNHQTSSILQIGTFWVLRRSRSCRHLPPFRSTIFRCAPCSYTSLQSKVSKPSLTAYQEQQHALTGRACLLRAGVCTLHCAAATLPLRYRCAITSLQLRCRSVAGSAIRTPQPAPACSAPTSCRSQASSVPPEPTVPQMTN